MRDPVLNFLKIAGVVAVTLYYARKSQQESLSIKSPEPFVDQTGKLADMLLSRSRLTPEAKERAQGVIRQMANQVMSEQIKRNGWEKKLT